MSTGAVVVRILSQYSDKGNKQAQKDLAKLGKSFDAYAKKASRAVGLVAVATTAAAVKIGKDSVMAASDVSQQFGALDAIFKSNSNQLKDFAKTMVEYGLSTADSARFSALLGTQLTGLGLSQQDAIDRTKQLQLLGADLAATFGGTTADAIASFGSVLKGEYNPIEKYGVAIRKSDITARIAAKGLGKLSGETLKAAEAQAAFELIMEKTTGAQGQAMREYNTLAAQLGRLKASFTNVEASLGSALLPVVEEFAGVLLKDVIPEIQKWVDTNKGELANSLKNAANFAMELLKGALKIARWASNNIGLLKAIAAVIATMFVATKLGNFVIAVTGMITTLKALKTQADLTNASTSKVGLVGKVAGKVGTAAVAIPILTDLWSAAVAEANAMNDIVEIEKQIKAANRRQDPITFGLLSRRLVQLKEELALAEKLRKERQKLNGVMIPYAQGLLDAKGLANAKLELEAQRVAEIVAKNSLKTTIKGLAAEGLREKVLIRLKKLNATPGTNKAKIGKGTTPFSTLEAAEQEAINFRAAELLLLKAKDNAAETEKLKKLRERITLQEISNKLADRYNDILVALADNSISDKDIVALAGKWKTTTDIARMYVLQVLGLGSIETGEGKVAMLETTWGMTNKQAKMYIDFTDLIKKGGYSTADIERVGAAHGLNADEAKKYYTYYKLIMDGELSDADILAIKQAYSDTNIQIVEMIEKLGVPVKVTGNILDATLIARLESHWIAAKKAMDDYYKAMNGYNNNGIQAPTIIPPTIATGCPTGSTMINGKCTPIGSNPNNNGTATDKAVADALAAKNKAAADAYAAAKAKGDMDAAAIAAAGVSPSALAAGESGAIGAASIASQLRAAEAARAAADAAARQASSLAAFKAKEAADAAASQAASAQLDIDERAKFRAAQGIMATAGDSGFKGLQAGGTQNIYVTVQGTVTGEQDLVQTIRNGLLRGQYNGQSTVLEAI
jgi:hypothetical protein